MSQKHLAAYLNDHLAGSTVAIELLNHLQESPEVDRSVIRIMRDEILADRHELERLMATLDVAQSTPRKVMAWVSEKLTHAKFWFGDSSDGELRLLEALEIISLGIEGKKALWRSLQNAARTEARLGAANYDHLISRADEQRAQIEVLRLEAARRALAGT